jgi:hypothetical protein
MAVVKGSVQHPLRVIPYRPMRRVFNYFLFFIILLIIAGACYLVGYDHGVHQRGFSNGQQDQVQQDKMERLTQEADGLRHELASFKLNEALDRKAKKEIHRQLAEQSAQIAALERDITVYRGMVSSGNNQNPQGISIGTFYVSPSEGANNYHFKLVVQKLAASDDVFDGQLSFELNGISMEGGEERPARFPLQALSKQYTDMQIALNFKYFQNIEGDLLLPQGFTPRTVMLVVKSSNKKYPATIEKELEWSVPGFAE